MVTRMCSPHRPLTIRSPGTRTWTVRALLVTQQVITTDANYAYSVFAADLDGDGDQDVLSASNNDGKIAWYENLDGDGTFGDQQVIATATSGGTGLGRGLGWRW